MDSKTMTEERSEIRILDELTNEQGDTFRLLLTHRHSPSLVADLYEVLVSLHMDRSRKSPIQSLCRLTDIFAGMSIKMPSTELVHLCARDAVLYHTLKSGAKPEQLASKYGLSQGAVWKLYYSVSNLVEGVSIGKEVESELRGGACIPGKSCHSITEIC